MNNEFINTNFPGCVSLLPDGAIDVLLKKDRPLRIKLGFDPTASDLHFGHTVLLSALKKFQKLGHQIVIILGDFTACIGDPTMRDVTRPPLNRAQVMQFVKAYESQLFRFLDKSKTEIHYNSAWLDHISLKDWIEIMGKVTVSQLMEREDFKNRLNNLQPIFGHEILYPLLQAYDSVAIKADIELGGTDQTFNLMMGRTLQKIFSQEAQLVMTFPLLEGLDGVKKMSKSYGNTIGIDESAESMYGKLMSISDNLMWQYYALLTHLNIQEIELKKQKHPLEAKHDLATLIVTDYHGLDAAILSRESFIARFSARSLDVNMQEFSVTKEQAALPCANLLKLLGLVLTSSEAIRLMRQGAVQLDGEKILTGSLPLESSHVLRVGKKILVRLNIVN